MGLGTPRLGAEPPPGAGRRQGMEIGITLEPLVVLTAILLALGLLVVIDRLGTLRRGELDDSEEEI
jgi:hypothetical protein